MGSRIKAVALLAWALLSTLLRMVFGKRPGLQQFHENYSAEGLTTVSQSQRMQMARFGRCIACGLCDRGDITAIAQSQGNFRSTMRLVLAASRSMPEFRAAQASFGALGQAQLRAKERLCPTQVPLGELAAFVAEHAHEQPESRRAES